MRNFEDILKNEGFSNLFNQSLMESLILFIDQDVTTKLEFERIYNLRYVGEIAERWQERNIVKSEKDLVGLIIGLSYANANSNFLYDQKSIFVKNVLSYIESNSINNSFLVKIALLNFMYKQDVESLKEYCEKIINDLLMESESLEKKEYFLDLILFANCESIFRMIDRSKDFIIIIKNILHFANFDLKNVDIDILIKFLLYYFKSKNNNLCNYDLKINEFKDNKLTIQKIKVLYKLVFSELKDTKIQEYKNILELDEYVLLYINYVFRGNLFKPAQERIRKLYIYYFFKFGKLEETRYYNVLKTIIGDGYLYSNRQYFSYASRYFDKITDNNLFVALCENLISNFDIKTYSTVIKSNKIDLLNQKCKENILKNVLLYSLDKYDFEKAYVYLEKNEISIDILKKDNNEIDGAFIFNLFRYNKINIYDFKFIKEHNLVEYLFEYYHKYDFIQKYLLLNIFPIESLNIGKVDFYSYDSSDILSKILSGMKKYDETKKKDLIEKYKLRDNNSIYDDDILITRSIINHYLHSLNFISPKNFVSSIYDVYNKKEFIDMMKWSDEEILEINKTLFDYKLITGDEYKELKKLFVSEDDLYKEEIDKLCVSLDSPNLSLRNAYYELNLKDFFVNNKKDIEKNKNLLDKFMNSIKQLLTKEKEKIQLNQATQLYFYIVNSNIVQEYKENIFKLINNYFIETIK